LVCYNSNYFGDIMEYKLGKFRYFDYLVVINQHYFKKTLPNFNVRVTDIEDIIYYNEIIKSFFYELSIETDINKIIEISLNLTGFLWFRQPFFDGNTRTLKRFLQLVFNIIHYEVSFSKKDTIIPVFYSDNETCTHDDILKLKRRLTFKAS